ncbi:hypothetical protein N7537_009302 [Penicillium hordei]|uniref:Nephrocystin 3-like N-terminal domain-containing protein n=1 Tax=Penicillium hordei TaxID=40994 RepID=A0AAD6DSG5_9EURO|nr:uncharacterized protein N7537_009302 [Penicillium hordei]KAJ5592398.1 hypothetical protein N7537_009302 [Penicillium hordei]
MFGKGNQDCQSYAKFVTTVAKQLGKKSPSIQQSIDDALRSDPSILDKGLEDQWNSLVLEPLAHFPKTQMSFLLVIDALDECTDGEWLLRKLLQKESTGLRILITSRPHLLPPDSSDTRYHHIVLHDIEPAIVNRDIRLFFQMAVNPRRHGWPDASSLELLMHKANGIFEWAALASRFLNKSKGVYKTNLQKLLGDGVSHPPQRALSVLYLTILDDYVKSQEWEPDSHFTCCGILRRYLGSLVVLFDQLSPRSFYKLIASDTDDIDVHDILSNLKSIIDFPNDEENSIDKIRIHHSTFREFLLDRELCTDDTFYVDKRAAHKVVLNGCLDLLLKTLKRGICQSDDPSFDHATAPSYPRQAITPEIQYACLNWVAHLIECGGTFYENATISRLLLNHSLHWLEVLGCMGRSVEALNALENLSSLAKACPCAPLKIDFL